jgi:hypothetical protein
MSLIGFTYGIWPGFLIASFASMLGAAIAFLSVRVSPFPSVFEGLEKAKLTLGILSKSQDGHKVGCIRKCNETQRIAIDHHDSLLADTMGYWEWPICSESLSTVPA